jgi:hypothetical protein
VGWEVKGILGSVLIGLVFAAFLLPCFLIRYPASSPIELKSYDTFLMDAREPSPKGLDLGSFGHIPEVYSSTDVDGERCAVRFWVVIEF